MNGIPARVPWVNKRAAINIHDTLSLISNISHCRPAPPLLRRPGYDLFNQHAAACQNSLCSLRSPMKTVFLPVSASNTSTDWDEALQSVIGKTTPNLDSVIFPNDIVSTDEVVRPFILRHLSAALPTIPLTSYLLHIRQEHRCFAIVGVVHLQ
jgi:hypothetical protein